MACLRRGGRRSAVGGRRSAVGGRRVAIDGDGGGGGAGDGRRGGSGLGLWFVVELFFVKKCLFKKKIIEAHAAPGGARRTLSAHALQNFTKPAPFSRRATTPQRPTNAPNKNNAGLIVYFASLPGGRRACSPDVRPRPAAWRRGCEERRAWSAGNAIAQMGHTHKRYARARHLVLCAPEPVGCRPSVSRPPPCAPVRAREPNGARGHREPKNRC